MENQIAFITCVNDKYLYSKCLQHINNLNIPDGYNVETIAIYDAKSLTSGYNRAMAKSNAKYKVYLHQDTFIVNKNFIIDITNVFSKSSKIGLIGMVGAKAIPFSGIWSESAKHIYGKVLQNSATPTNEMKLFFFNDIVEDYKIVKCVDGLILITQYDIPWREDIFDGWDFYDISQCMEFYKKGYQVCVPKQNDYWCIHDCGKLNMKNYDKYRHIFLKEYATKVFVFSNLMPTLYTWNKKLRPYQKKIETFIKKFLNKRNKISCL